MEEYRQEELKKIVGKFATGEGANDADYDPHKYRTVAHGTNYIETLGHVIKATIGTGILAMPNGFKNAGLFTGSILTVIVGMICTYGIYLVVSNQYLVCKRLRVPYISYPSLMRASASMGPNKLTYCGKCLEFTVNAFILIFLTGICIIYIIFVSANIKAIVDEKLGYAIEIKTCMLYLFIPFLMLLMPPNLKVLAPLSLISDTIFLLIYFAIMFICFQGLGNITERRAFGEWIDIPLMLGTVLFSTSAIGPIVTIERNMESPKNFLRSRCGILNLSMSVIVLMYLSMGFVGYWRFGDETKDTITLNLGEKSHVSSAIQAMAAAAVFLSYGLNAYVPVDLVWLCIEQRYTEIKNPLLYNYILRLIFVIFTFTVAITMPLLDPFISLFGAFCTPVLQVIFPALMDICLKWPSDFGKFYWIFVLNVLVMFVGVTTTITGTYTSVRDIIAALNK